MVAVPVELPALAVAAPALQGVALPAASNELGREAQLHCQTGRLLLPPAHLPARAQHHGQAVWAERRRAVAARGLLRQQLRRWGVRLQLCRRHRPVEVPRPLRAARAAAALAAAANGVELARSAALRSRLTAEAAAGHLVDLVRPLPRVRGKLLAQRRAA